MIDILIMLGVLAIFCVVAWFVLSQIDLPDPIRKIIIIILVIVAGVLAIGFLMSFRGGNHSFKFGELGSTRVELALVVVHTGPQEPRQEQQARRIGNHEPEEESLEEGHGFS